MSQRVKQHRCKRKSCIDHMPGWSEYGCNYAAIVGRTRSSQLPEDMRDPAQCPLYRSGKRQGALITPMAFPGSRPKTEPERGKLGMKKPTYDWAAIQARYEAGARDIDIVREFGCAANTIYAWRKRRGLPANGPNGKKEKE